MDPMAPIYFLVIYGQEDFVQINYPGDFKEEKSIRDLILPRTPDEIDLIVSQSRIEVGWCRFRHKSRENIERILEFNGIAARCGISLEQFQKRLRAHYEVRTHE
jgi:hypothetical protein